MLCFLGNYFKDFHCVIEKEDLLNKLFSSKENIQETYSWIKSITEDYPIAYGEKYGENGDYNRMVKKEIDWNIFVKSKECLVRYNKTKRDSIKEIIGNC